MSWDQETIGKRIRRLREKRGLTQGQLGETTDLSEASIDRIEKEAARLLGEYIERLANRLAGC